MDIHEINNRLFPGFLLIKLVTIEEFKKMYPPQVAEKSEIDKTPVTIKCMEIAGNHTEGKGD